MHVYNNNKRKHMSLMSPHYPILFKFHLIISNMPNWHPISKLYALLEFYHLFMHISFQYQQLVNWMLLRPSPSNNSIPTQLTSNYIDLSMFDMQISLLDHIDSIFRYITTNYYPYHAF